MSFHTNITVLRCNQTHAKWTSPRLFPGKFEKEVQRSSKISPEYEQIAKTAKNFPKETILTRIHRLPSVLKSIIERRTAEELNIDLKFSGRIFCAPERNFPTFFSIRGVPNRTSPKIFLMNHGTVHGV
jgi:hypothetical protein